MTHEHTPAAPAPGTRVNTPTGVGTALAETGVVTVRDHMYEGRRWVAVDMDATAARPRMISRVFLEEVTEVGSSDRLTELPVYFRELADLRVSLAAFRERVVSLPEDPWLTRDRALLMYAAERAVWLSERADTHEAREGAVREAWRALGAGWAATGQAGAEGPGVSR